MRGLGRVNFRSLSGVWWLSEERGGGTLFTPPLEINVSTTIAQKNVPNLPLIFLQHIFDMNLWMVAVGEWQIDVNNKIFSSQHSCFYRSLANTCLCDGTLMEWLSPVSIVLLPKSSRHISCLLEHSWTSTTYSVLILWRNMKIFSNQQSPFSHIAAISWLCDGALMEWLSSRNSKWHLLVFREQDILGMLCNSLDWIRQVGEPD